ncbi:MAG: methylated-DNA--[protein]-cysteine S-methyltransferase [Bacteroidales bacterium]|nr:methylated-DNA--[protein]-cysteine S-methyltransferase [Bacteroidales bacterium]
MENTKEYYYNKVANAIEYLESNFIKQPTLDDIAKQVHISPYHFQKIFTEWVGVSPKKYLQFLSIRHAKQILNHQTLAETANNTGLSGTGRLHDMFVNIEGMTPGEYKNGGKKLAINYNFSESYFGKILIASTTKGICHIGFSGEGKIAISDLSRRFPNALIYNRNDEIQNSALAFFNADWNNLSEIKLHLKGTEFQLKVWDALLKIPMGSLSTYGEIAQHIGKPKASRAVGTAIGNNPIAQLIPCHRVIQASGNSGQYYWGSVRKKAMIGWEAAKLESF